MARFAPKGLRFTCTGCGDCCRAPGVVEFDGATLQRMAHHLDQSVAVFQARHSVQWDPGASRFWVDVPPDSACPLLDGDRCRVHPVKPVQCRTFPFWPEVIQSRRTWERTAQGCPGMDHPEADWVPWSEVRRKAREADCGR